MEKMIPQRINSVRPDAHELQTQSFICITPRMLAACLAAPFFPAVILAVLATARISGDSWIGLLIFPIWACSYSSGFVILGLPGIFMLNKHKLFDTIESFRFMEPSQAPFHGILAFL
ncbi:hypothetical protein [Delftia sp.]|uniref:hypothetical protein n=1 Tax=Delftia sp. TaxID=1886637 RepID=UPI00259D16C2|nr:hypothetical protein [Delftia sp.]